jgi:hypothetical protein
MLLRNEFGPHAVPLVSQEAYMHEVDILGGAFSM